MRLFLIGLPKQPKQEDFAFFLISKLFFVAPRTGNVRNAAMGRIMGLFPGIVCVILT